MNWTIFWICYVLGLALIWAFFIGAARVSEE